MILFLIKGHREAERHPHRAGGGGDLGGRGNKNVYEEMKTGRCQRHGKIIVIIQGTYGPYIHKK